MKAARIIPCSVFQIPRSSKRGALLLELLIAISVLAIILSVGAQAVFVSLQSGKVSGERDVAMGLASEALEAARAVTEEKWQNIYNLTKTAQHYYATSTAPAGKWTLATGDETIALNTAIYTRFIIVQNVCREMVSTRNITGITDTDGSLTTCAGSGGVFDPSTQKISVVVSWAGDSTMTVSDYFLRWQNKVCAQTDWSGGAGSGAKNCPDSTYGSAESSISTAGGILKLQ